MPRSLNRRKSMSASPDRIISAILFKTETRSSIVQQIMLAMKLSGKMRGNQTATTCTSNLQKLEFVGFDVELLDQHVIGHRHVGIGPRAKSLRNMLFIRHVALLDVINVVRPTRHDCINALGE